MSFFSRKKEKSFDDIQRTVDEFSQEAFHLIQTYNRTGFSKIGSTPVVPYGFEWPSKNGKSLAFLMQLKFSEINSKQQISHLPPSGLLYVFYDQEQSTWGFDPSDKGSWQILFFPETNELKGKHYPKDMKVRYKEKMLTSKIIKTYPSSFDERIEALNLTDTEEDLYNEYKNSFYSDKPAHQIGGYPNPIQSADMDLECELVSNGLYCGDCGTLYFWIRKKDLAELNFDDVWMILQCN